jgi:uncharacterized protein
MNLATLNPWWEHKNSIENDKHIRALNNFRYIYHSPLLKEQFRRSNVYTIRGPRQIGKTTFLKLLIKEKLTSIPKENIFYWSCDNLSSKDDLITLLRDYSDYCKIKNAKPEFILLDEITEIKDWQKAIKFVIDNDITEGSCFILTGSNAIDLKKGTERLPGRRGKYGKDLFFLPLTFREYVKLVNPDWYEKHRSDTIKELKYSRSKLKILFEKYLITGGIPLVINEYELNKEIPNYIYDLYYSWIIGDVLKEGKTEQTLKEIIKSILICYSTPISWDSLAKRSSVKSHLTISSYFELLSNLFVVYGCFFFDIGQNTVNYNKNKKIYMYDPFFVRIFSDRLNITVETGKIVEGIVGAKIKQKNVLDDVYFTKIKKETDFVLSSKTAREVKYQNSVSKEDFVNKHYFKDFKLLSKDVFDENTIPVYVYLFTVKI